MPSNIESLPTTLVRQLPSVRRNSVALVLVLLGIFYVGNAWTPSHYGIVLSRFGLDERGPVIGVARPIRSDEWGVITPLFQTAVNNGFERYNKTSPYVEDLRSFTAIPIRDWSMAFKPQLWAFFLIDPAYALSMYHYVLIASFILGYALLFRRLGVPEHFALIGSLVLFFSRYTQVWWGTAAPVLAFAPWPVIVLLHTWKWYWKAGFLAYALAVWFFSLLYPPTIISLVFVFLILVLALRPSVINPSNAITMAVAAVIATGLVYLYLRDVIPVMQATAYPGRRESIGGGVDFLLLLSHFLPFISALQFAPLVANSNECNVGVAGSFLLLFAVIFVDHRALIAHLRSQWRVAATLMTGILMIGAWMVLPVPAEIGKLLLWHLVPPERMLFASGLLLTALVVAVFLRVPWRLGWLRVSLFTTVIVVVWLASKASLPRFSFLDGWFDWVVIVLLGLVMFARVRWPAVSPRVALGLVAVATNAVTFGTFNPIQSAWPIFHRPHLPQVEAMREMAAAHPRGWLAIEGGHTAYLNGLGLPAINHVLLAPALPFFREVFPDMPEGQFNTVFNRYSHVGLSLDDEPRVLQADAIAVPLKRFAAPLKIDVGKPVQTGSLGGAVDRSIVFFLPDNRQRIIIRGWGEWSGYSPDQKMQIGSRDASIDDAWATRVVRADVSSARRDSSLSLSGFVLAFETELINDRGNTRWHDGIHVTTVDDRFGTVALPNVLMLDVRGPESQPELPRLGHLDKVEVSADGRRVGLFGWAPFANPYGGQVLTVHTNLRAISATVVRHARDDVAAVVSPDLLLSGFAVTLSLDAPISRDELRLCLTASDGDRGTFLLNHTVEPSPCLIPG